MLSQNNTETFNNLVDNCTSFTNTLKAVFTRLSEQQTLAYLDHPGNIDYAEVVVNVNQDGADYTHDDLRQVVALVAEPIADVAALVSGKIRSDFNTTKARIEREVFHYAVWCMISRKTLPVKTNIQEVICQQIIDFQKFPRGDFLAFVAFMTLPTPTTASTTAK